LIGLHRKPALPRYIAPQVRDLTAVMALVNQQNAQKIPDFFGATGREGELALQVGWRQGGQDGQRFSRTAVAYPCKAAMVGWSAITCSRECPTPASCGSAGMPNFSCHCPATQAWGLPLMCESMTSSTRVWCQRSQPMGLHCSLGRFTRSA